MNPSIELAGITVGVDYVPQIFVEIGINHGGELEVALNMAQAAISAGAKFIKHQTHIPDAEMSKEAETVVPGNDEVIKRNSLSLDEEKVLADYVRSHGAVFFSTPFSREAVEHLESIEVPFYKIGSGECNNYPFVDFVASTGKPVVLSTGMNDVTSVTRATEILQNRGVPFALLHTTNLYPTPHSLLRLGGLTELMENFSVPIGLSDHSTSNAACLGAVALGASLLERHFVDTKSRVGPDVSCSMDPNELMQLLDWSSQLFAARGGKKFLSDEEQITANFAFASVSATRDIEPGEILTRENCFPIRPGNGEFLAQDFEGILGRRVIAPIEKRTQITSDRLEQEKIGND
jgi:N-acetylneuraminate synthase